MATKKQAAGSGKKKPTASANGKPAKKPPAKKPATANTTGTTNPQSKGTKKKPPAKPAAAPSSPSAAKPPGKKPTASAAPALPVAQADAIDYSAKDALDVYDAETAETAGEQVQKIYKLQAEWEQLHSEAAKAKKEYEAAQKEHLSYMRERFEGRGKPPKVDLFTGIDEEEMREKIATKKKKPTASAPELPAENAGGWYPADLWKRYPLAKLPGITEKDLEALAAPKVRKAKQIEGQPAPSGIYTVGDVSWFEQPDAAGLGYKLGDLEKITPKAVERIENAITSFTAAWPDMVERFAVDSGFTRPDPFADLPPEAATDGTIPQLDAGQPADALADQIEAEAADADEDAAGVPPE